MAKTVLLAFLSLLLVVTIIMQPDAAFQSSLQGLTVWWNIVFPGLLPFLVLFELIMAFGLAHAAGSLLQPLMGKLFKLPGEAALVIVLGWMGGYPGGAEATASLRKRSIVSKQQGQRLLALSHMPNPLFMLIVIGAGFLHMPIEGAIIATTVWLSAIWMMLLMTLFSRKKQTGLSAVTLAERKPKPGILYQAAEALRLGREQDGRSFGKALGDAVTSSVQRLMIIGGFMIFAAVIAKLAEPLFSPLTAKTGLSFLGQALFEGHIGTYAAAVWDAPGTSTLANAAAIAAVLAWSGLSGILQASYSVSGTDIRLLPFIAWRAVHALHAAVFMVLLWKPITSFLTPLLAPGATPTFTAYGTLDDTLGPFTTASFTASELPILWQHSLFAFVIITLLGAALSILLRSYHRAGRSL